MRLLRYLDLILLVAALPVFIVGDLPMIGYVVGGGAWLLQRAINAAFTAKAEASDDPRSIVGLMAGSMIARGWLVALSVFLVGLTQGDEAGLSAGLLVITLFTVYFTMQMILRPFDSPSVSQ